jgi:hypothetical protein
MKGTLNYSVRFHLSNILPMIDRPLEVAAYLDSHGIPEPKAKNEDGFKMRLLCYKWWRRTLERIKARDDESQIVKAGRVARHKEKYCSNLAVFRTGKKACSTDQFMKTQMMVSDTGDFVDMSTILTASIANPTNRRAELMIRMAGFESYAQQNGFVGEFYTITCPSKYHRFTGKTLNDKYTELSPREAQHYLVKQWSKIRAAYGRLDIHPFGFRVAEPHGDSCPHWHMLLFVKAEQLDDLRAIFSKYALEVDGDEAGADKHRFKVVAIDSEVGTATGYIAKYISKNLGFSIDDPEHDTTDKSKSYGHRVKSWASTWGIRQFQQIGGASVTVWRQLRKLSHSLDDELLESARQAADESRWDDFFKIMGGADAKRKDHTIQLLKSQVTDIETGELKQNQYLELVELVFGVVAAAAQAVTRKKQWKMFSSNHAASMLVQTLDGGVAATSRFTTWSPVNNCTA